MSILTTLAMACCLLQVLHCIQQACISDVNCPINSFCNPQSYCQCIQNYINNNCQTYATPITASPSSISISANNPNFYSIQANPTVYISTLITLSNPTNINSSNFNVAFYVDDGITLVDLNSASTNITIVGNQIFATILPTMKLGLQINSQPDIIIMVIQENINAALTVQYEISELKTSSGLLIVGYVTGGILIVTGILIIVFCYRRRNQAERRPESQNNQTNKDYNIDHFQRVMPGILVNFQIKSTAQACSVCLLEFQLSVIVRKTVCNHIFHKHCLDAWCIKNLNCPNCRTELDQDNINSLKNQQQKTDRTDWIINTINQDQDQGYQLQSPLNFEHHQNDSL